MASRSSPESPPTLQRAALAPGADVRVWIDGAEVKPAEARVSVFDRGFLYGDSVFETLRTYGGRAFALEEHLERLARSAALVHLRLPVSLDVLRAEIEGALESVRPDRAHDQESYLRLTVTRGSGPLGLDPANATEPLRVLIVAPLHAPPAVAYERGVSVITYATQRVGDATPAAGAKVGNYLVAVLALSAAKAQGAAEALIVDGEGNVVEGSTSNVFAVRAGTLYTPSEAEGILPGITRRVVLEVAESLGVPVRLGPLSRAELLAADEVFISSSLRELLPVVRVDEAAIGEGAPGPVTGRLLAEFRRRVREVG